jgi:hypothetical protein
MEGAAARQQVWALSHVVHDAFPPGLPAAPLVPPVPLTPPPPLVPPVPLAPAAPVAPPVPVPLEPPVPSAHAGTVVAIQSSSSEQVVLARQAFPAARIALWLEQAPPVLVVPAATHRCMQSAVVAPASAPHSIASLAQPCMQRLVTLPAPDELDPHPCTAPSANPATKNDPITAETDFLDITRYLLLVLWKGGRYHGLLAVHVSSVTIDPRFH